VGRNHRRRRWVERKNKKCKIGKRQKGKEDVRRGKFVGKKAKRDEVKKRGKKKKIAEKVKHKSRLREEEPQRRDVVKR